MHRTSSSIAALVCFALMGSGCGLTDALVNSGNPRIFDGPDGGGVDPGDVGDADTPRKDAGDTGGPAECTPEGAANGCSSDEICYRGKCEPRCGFGPFQGLGQGIFPTDRNGTIPTCDSGFECVPTIIQDANRFGACVSTSRFEDLQTNPSCADVDPEATNNESPEDDYCKQLMRDPNIICQSGRCEFDCSDDDDCGDGEACLVDTDQNRYCAALNCAEIGSDPLAQANYCADFFNRNGVEHPNGGEATFSAADSYCLNGACFIRTSGEATTACSDQNVCGGEEVCVGQDYCMAACSSDDDCLEGLFCAYTLPGDEDLDTDEDVSPFVCVNPDLVNIAQLADPLAFCDDDFERDGATGTAYWDRFEDTCRYDTTPLDNSVWYVLIQDTTQSCDGSASDGDLPDVEDPGVDIAFVGLSDTNEQDPSLGQAFGTVYADGQVVKVIPGPGGLDNDYPGVGHLSALFPADGGEPERRYSATDGCPVDPPAPNNTFSLGCGGAILVEFRHNGRRDDGTVGERENLNPEHNKFIVVSEYNESCPSANIQPGNSIPERLKVTYCSTGITIDGANPGSCATEMVSVTDSTNGGPSVFSFP